MSGRTVDETGRRVDGRTLRHQHRRPEIVAALAEYVLDYGVADFSLRPAAAAIGVTHATLLRHFATREELIHEVVAKVRHDVVADTFDDLGATPRPADLIVEVWRRLTAGRALRQFPLLYELVADVHRAHGDHNRVRDSLADDLMSPFRDLFVQRFSLSLPAADDLTTLVVSQYRGLAMDVILSGDRTRADRLIAQFAETIAAPGR